MCSISKKDLIIGLEVEQIDADKSADLKEKKIITYILSDLHLYAFICGLTKNPKPNIQFDSNNRIETPLTLLYHQLQNQHTGGQLR